MGQVLALILLASNIHGAVTNGNAPVANAKIILRNDSSNQAEYGTTSASDGTFSLTNIAAGRYRLSVEKDGYVTYRHGQRHPDGPGTTLVFSNASDDRTLEIRLTPTASISGRVLDGNGNPLVRAEVRLYTKRLKNGEPSFLQVSTATTNDLGEYRAFGLVPGTYYVAAVYSSEIVSSAKTLRVDQSNKTEQYIPTFYPGVGDPDAATPIEVSPGVDARSVDVSMNRARQIRIRGILSGCVYQIPSTVRIDAARRTPSISQLNVSRQGRVLDMDGHFEIVDVPAGSYLLSVSVGEVNAAWTQMQIEVGGENVDNLVIRCAKRVELHGRVRMEAGTKLPERVSIGFESVYGSGNGYATRIKADGTFAAVSFPPGHYWLVVRQLPESVFVKSITLDGLDVLSRGITLDGVMSAPIEITLSDKPGSVEGTVFDDDQRPAANMKVVIIPEPRLRERSDLYSTAQTDENGRFQIGRLTPGDYELYTWEWVEVESYRDPIFLARYRSQAKLIHLNPGVKATTNLTLLK